MCLPDRVWNWNLTFYSQYSKSSTDSMNSQTVLLSAAWVCSSVQYAWFGLTTRLGLNYPLPSPFNFFHRLFRIDSSRFPKSRDSVWSWKTLFASSESKSTRPVSRQKALLLDAKLHQIWSVGFFIKNLNRVQSFYFDSAWCSSSGPAFFQISDYWMPRCLTIYQFQIPLYQAVILTSRTLAWNMKTDP